MDQVIGTDAHGGDVEHADWVGPARLIVGFLTGLGFWLLFEAAKAPELTDVQIAKHITALSWAQSHPLIFSGVMALVMFTPDMQQQSAHLKKFLFAQLYRHPQVVQTMAHAKQIVQDLFAAYCADPRQMQAGFAARAQVALTAAEDLEQGPQRIVADYIAGMTDRFAAREHQRLTGMNLLA